MTKTSIINITRIKNSNPYAYFIYNGLEYGNDPVGYIPYFQSITIYNGVTDGLYRDDTFFEPQWTCLKCIDGQGLSDDFLSCSPCPDPCITCYMAQNYSCLTEKKNNITNTTNNTIIICQGYIDFNTGACISNCSATN